MGTLSTLRVRRPRTERGRETHIPTHTPGSTLERMARHSLQDLVRSGAITVGTEVYHPGRQHPDRSVTGRITAAGIEVAGKVYASPSGAARAVTGGGAENGWRWWRVKPDGRTLADLRPQA